MLVQVFLVDTGTMYHVEANITHPVSCLNEEIERVSRIPVERQVLLMSGGVTLFSEKPLSHYASILDNPVYLISKELIQDIIKPASGSLYRSDQELTSQVEASLQMQPSMDAVKCRTQLASRVVQFDRVELKIIEELVYDQHLQQQGWAAVVANLEDLMSGFEKRALALQHEFREFLKFREDVLSLLRRMPEVLVLLEKVPVLPCLELSASRTSVSLKSPLELLQSFNPPGKLTLYTWMNTQDYKHRLEDVIREVSNCINQMQDEILEKIDHDMNDIISYASGPRNEGMKNIKGLEARLYGLDKLVNSAKATIESQVNMAKAFEQNRQRLEVVKDNSILPDLCASHRKQMKDMLTNHRKLVDLKHKCADAKTELSENLKQRLTVWVMDSHRMVSDMDNRLVLYHDMLQRIKSRSEFLGQVEKAPQVYAAMVVEVARRRLFSLHYMKWAKGVAEESIKEHKKEMHRRRMFTKQYGSHFLRKMFVGFHDNVPKFASEPPKDIDSELPDISTADIEQLAHCVPELKQQLRVPTGTGSPAISFTTQDPLMIEVTQSILSSTTISITAVSQRSVSDSLDNIQVPLLEALDLDRMPSFPGGGDGKDSKGPSGEDALFFSLQDFPVPQCLSETLTAEVNSAALSTISSPSTSVVCASPKSRDLTVALEDLTRQQEQQQGGSSTDGGTLFSSGDLEPTKSSDSDVAISQNESLSDHKSGLSATGKKRKTASKGLTDTSPEEGETSTEFTTADFYIEDSMPSSMTDSPPKPDSKQLRKDDAEVKQSLEQEKKKVAELEGEVSTLQSRLSESEEKLLLLRSLLSSDVASLRESLQSLKASVEQKDVERSVAVTEVKEGMVGMLALLLERLDQEKEECVGRGRVDGRMEMEEQLRVKCQLVDDLQQASLKVTHGIADLTKELQQTRECYQREVDAVKEQHEVNLKELSAKSAAESEALLQRHLVQLEEVSKSHAAEMERLKAELNEERTKKVEELAQLQAKLTTELEDSEKKHLLETELEMEKQREELQEAFNKQEVVLQQQLTDLQEQLNKVVAEKAQTAESMEQGFARERKELQRILEEEKQKSLAQITSDIRREEQHKFEAALLEEHEKMGKREEEWTTKLDNTLKEEREKLEEEKKRDLEDVKSTHQATLAQRVDSVEKVWQSKMAAREAELEREFEHQLKMAEATILQAVPTAPSTNEQETQSDEGGIITMEQHHNLLCQMRKDYEKEQDQLMAMKDAKYLNDKEAALLSLRKEIVAEQQAQLSEAISRAMEERDSTIQQLYQQLLSVSSPVDDDRNVDESGHSVHSLMAKARDTETSLREQIQVLEDKVQMLKCQVQQYCKQYHAMTASAMPLLQSQSMMSDTSTLTHSGLEESEGADWKEVAKNFERKNRELSERLMSISMTASMRKEVKDKVSILTCNIGDLVLLCLDERHGQYVVFTVNNTLHFLHNDCLEALGLTPVEGTLRKNWVLAEVTDREYCQARKPQNRFKVPVNTKFYRVKAKLWNPQGTPSSSSTSSSTMTASSTTASSPTSPTTPPPPDSAGI